ncbi:MAG: hypothetical protein M3H12_03100, partial [Chromatiales bacterium]
ESLWSFCDVYLEILDWGTSRDAFFGEPQWRQWCSRRLKMHHPKKPVTGLDTVTFRRRRHCWLAWLTTLCFTYSFMNYGQGFRLLLVKGLFHLIMFVHFKCTEATRGTQQLQPSAYQIWV